MKRTATIAHSAEGEKSLTLKLPPGDLGTDCSIAAMRAIAEDAAESSDRVKKLARMLNGHGLGPLNLYNWCRAHAKFRRDTPGFEHVRHPDQVLRQIEAEGIAEIDCDCLATLACAVLLRMHWRPAFVVVARQPAPEPFAHVFWATIINAGHLPSILPDNKTAGRTTFWDPQERTPPGQMPEGVRRFRVYPFPP